MSKISNNNFKNIINSIVEMIKDNKRIIKMIYEEDKEFYDIEIDIDKLLQLFEQYKSETVISKEYRKILISYYGNPYITVMLCVESLMNNCGITLATEGMFYGLNKAIVKIVNDILREYQIDKLIVLQDNLTKEDIEKMNLDKIVCLGNSNSYMHLRKIKNIKIENIPLFDISLYYDSNEYEELVEFIRNYAVQNFYEIEIFDETEDFDDVMYIINHDFNKYCNILLSKNRKKQEKFKKNINSGMIVINENPFQKFKLEIPKKVWKEVV